MLLVYRHTLIVLYICLCIACFAGNIVWASLLFNNASSNPSDSTETIITIKSDVSVKLLKGVCIILNVIVIPILIYFFYLYRKTWW